MRTSNLIQSYISTHPANQQYQSDKVVKDFDVHKELRNRTFIKPLPSNGKLLKPTIFDMPSEIRKDFQYDVRAFKRAVKGEANDHELGKLNDFGTKLGGLAIAAYLFSRKQTPMTKVFEFIGLGTFFGAMDLWPKLFIQLPAKLIHGVNVGQEYEDSFGRKKDFYQDHQFIPWDLYSEKEINSIGDRLGVPKNIPNRREFIQEKMRKIALQNNTLWMLTAGFATPLMSALMCNALEKPVAAWLDRRVSNKADSLMANFAQESQKIDFSQNSKALSDILAEAKGKPVTPEMIEAIQTNITEGLDQMVANGVRKDIKGLLEDGKYSFGEAQVSGVRNALKGVFAKLNLPAEDLDRILPSVEAISDRLHSLNAVNGEFNNFAEQTRTVQNLLKESVEEFIKANPDNPVNKKLLFSIKQAVHSSEHGVDSPIMQAFKAKPAMVMSDSLIDTLKSVSETLNGFKAKSYVLDKFAFMKSAQAPETGLANAWNGMTDVIMKTLNFTPEEISNARLDRELAGSILRNKLETVTSDKAAYENFVSAMEKSLSALQSRVSSLDMAQDAKSNPYKQNVIATYDTAAEALRHNGFESSSEALVGFWGKSTHPSAKDLQLDFVTDRIRGVKSSFYRFLNLADMYYRISNVEGVENVLSSEVPREVKEEIVELAKSTILDGHTSDFAVKFWQRRNPSPNREDYSQIETKAGKVINRFFGTHESSDVVELANDRNFFDKVMKLMFGGDIHKDTVAKIGDSSFYADFLDYRQQVLSKIGGDFYFVKPNFLVDGHRVDTSSNFKFLLMGSAPDEMFSKIANQSFNSRTWFKKFGRLGAGLIGVTLVSQFFFGRMKNPKVAKEGK